MAFLPFVTIWISLATTCVAVLCYTAVFIHCIFGSKDKWILGVSSMLWLGNVITIFNLLVDKELISDNYNEKNVSLLAMTWGMSSSLIGTAYYLIAKKYMTIAEKIPQKFAGEAPKEGMPYALHLVLLLCNVVIPLVASVFFWIYNI